jgi:hypothetical protein
MSMAPLKNPNTGTLVFAQIPALQLSGLRFPEAEAFLFLGKHLGPSRGFGARHIWAEHRTEMGKAGFLEEQDVALYVLSIMRAGTPLIFEGASWRVTRVMAVRAAAGTAILEFREQREGAIWSVVTAYSGTKTHGTRVGTVR